MRSTFCCLVTITPRRVKSSWDELTGSLAKSAHRVTSRREIEEPRNRRTSPRLILITNASERLPVPHVKAGGLLLDSPGGNCERISREAKNIHRAATDRADCVIQEL